MSTCLEPVGRIYNQFSCAKLVPFWHQINQKHKSWILYQWDKFRTSKWCTTHPNCNHKIISLKCETSTSLAQVQEQLLVLNWYCFKLEKNETKFDTNQQLLVQNSFLLEPVKTSSKVQDWYLIGTSYEQLLVTNWYCFELEKNETKLDTNYWCKTRFVCNQ